ncbi:c-type cytochrome [Roseivirga echinicomitans]
MKQKTTWMSLVLMVVTFIFASSCTNGKEKKSDASEEKSEMSNTEILSPEQALNLLETNCYICHNPSVPSHDALLAPPLAGIKTRYMTAAADRPAFIKQMATFVSNPSEDLALMKGPINRFGVMPITGLKRNQIDAIVAYIYDNEIPQPTWFEEHEQEMHKDSEQ